LIKAMKEQGLLPAQLEPPLRVIQNYGNYGSHYQRHEGIDDQVREQVARHYVGACLDALGVVCNWYLSTFHRTSLENGVGLSQNIPEVSSGVEERRAYLQVLRRRLEARTTDYVELQRQSVPGLLNDQGWPESAITYVTGEYGAGKSYFCAAWFARLCESAQATVPLQDIPVTINVSDIDLEPSRVSEIDPQAGDALARLLRLAPPLVRPPPLAGSRCCVLIDGLDELEGTSAEALIRKVVELASEGSGDWRFVLAARVNALRLHAHHLLLDGSIDQNLLPTKANTMALAQLDEGGRASLLARRISDHEERVQVRSFVEGRRNLRELVSRPLVLALLTHSPMGEPSVLSSLLTANTGDADITLGYVFDAVVDSYWARLRRAGVTYVEELQCTLGRLAVRQLDSPTLKMDVISREIAVCGIPEAQRDEALHTLLTSTFLSAHPSGQGMYQFHVRSFRDYFIAFQLGTVEELAKAVDRFSSRLQLTLCRRGVVDFLRDRMGEEHKSYLVKLLRGDDRTIVFASHLLRRSLFADCLPDLEDAFERCRDLQGRVLIVFAILSHADTALPGMDRYLQFVGDNRAIYRETLKLFVEGVERDVLDFNIERLNMKEHRNKAALYLLSLADPAIAGEDPELVGRAVRRFMQHGSRLSAREEQLAKEIMMNVS
jgi:hypothetical protein